MISAISLVPSLLILTHHLSLAVDELGFTNWLSRHEKSYSDEREYLHRLNIFAANAEVVERHNDAYEKGYTSYVMTIDSPFADLSDDEFKQSHLMEYQNCSATSSGKLPTPE